MFTKCSIFYILDMLTVIMFDHKMFEQINYYFDKDIHSMQRPRDEVAALTSPEKSPEKSTEKSLEKSPEKSPEKSLEKCLEK